MRNSKELADISGLSHSVIHSTLEGEYFPQRETLGALLAAMAVEGSVRLEMLFLHEEARKALRAVAQSATKRPPVTDWRVPVPAAGEPDPVLFSTAKEFVAGLEDVRVWAGEPSLRRLEERSARLHQQRQTAYGKVLRRSTISDMLNATSLPQMEKVRHFLQICGVRDIDAWVYTWRRVRTIEKAALRRAA
ncbi:hypothetical protein [Kitasatospora sp. NPDC001225]